MVTTGGRPLGLVAFLSFLSACGGGSSSGGDGEGGLSARILWEQPAVSSTTAASSLLQQTADRFGPQLPGAARTMRFVFSSAAGDACCVAVDPRTIPVDPHLQQRVLVLTQLPVGMGSLSVSAFPTDFAPRPPGITATCATRPASAAEACDQARDQSPSFASDPQDVNIRVGTNTDAGDVRIRSFPFVVPDTVRPGVDEEAFNPVTAEVTIAEAVSGVDPSSVRLDLFSNGVAAPAQALQLTACNDAGGVPCSPGGSLEVTGFVVTRPAQQLTPGGAEARIEARNLAAPPRALDVSYSFSVRAAAPTVTAGATVTATRRPSATTTRTPSAVATATSRRTPTATPVPSRTATPTRRATSTVAPTRTRTPTGSPAPSPQIVFANAEPITVSARPQYLTTSDVDLDGNADLIVISPASQEMNVLLGSPESASRFTPVTVFTFGERLRQPVVGDLNADGNPDIVVPDNISAGVWLVLGNGDGTFVRPRLLSVGNAPFAVAVADFDGRPGDDLAVADRQRNTVALRLSNGANPLDFSLGTEVLCGPSPEEIVAVDLNRDGHADLATLNAGNATIGVLLWQEIAQDGSPVFAGVVSYDAGDRPLGLASSDVDGDGGMDLLLLDRPSGELNHDLRVYLSRGDGALDAPARLDLDCPFATSNACPSRGFATADFEQDGNVDVAVAMVDPRGPSNGDTVGVWRGKGDGTFTNGSFFPAPEDVTAISAGNYAGGGRIDLAVSSDRDISVQVLINISILASGGN